MVYVRSKTIKGNTYYYLQKSMRVNGKVITKHIKYLGKNPGLKTKKKVRSKKSTFRMKKKIITRKRIERKCVVCGFDNIERKCMICGFDKTVDIHHVSKNKVVILCPNHHAQYHRKGIDISYLQPVEIGLLKRKRVSLAILPKRKSGGEIHGRKTGE